MVDTRLRTAAVLVAVAILFALPAAALAAPAAEAPDSPYETRGRAPVVVTVVSDGPGHDFTVTSAPTGGVLSDQAASGNQTSWTYTPDNGFAGLDSFTVTVDDGEGTTQVTVAVAVRPTTQLVSGPGVGATPGLTNTSTPTFTFKAVTGSEDVSGASYRCRVDTGSFVACNSGSFTTAALADGPHTFTARAATDNGLNPDPQPPTVAFTVDTTAPSVAITSGPDGTIGPNRATFALGDATDANGPVAVACRLITPSSPSPAFGTCPGTYTGLAEGEHTFQARATDAAGNAAVVSRSFTVENTPPSVEDESRSTEGVLGVDVGTTDADGDPLTYTVDDGPDHGIVTQRAGGAGLRYVAAGDFAGADSFTYTVSDGRGGTDTATVSLTVTPQTAITEGPSGTTGVARPAFSFTSPQTQSFECQLAPADDFSVADGTWTACDGGSFQPAAGLADGDYVFGVRAVSGDETDPTPVTRAFSVGNGGPGIGALTFDTEGTAPVSVTVGPATDADGDPLTYSLAEGPSLGSLDDEDDVRQFVYTADEGKAGVETIEVDVTDGRGGDETVVVTIDVAPLTTIDTTPDDRTADAQPTWEFSSPTSGADFQCRVDDGDWAACDDGSFTPQAPLADGLRTFAVRAVVDGVADPTPASDAVVVDTTGPSVTFDSGPEDGDTAASPAFTWSTTADDQVDPYRCRVFPSDAPAEERPAFADCAPGARVGPLTRTTAYTFEVRAEDDLGNAAVTAYEWTRPTRPRTPTTSPPRPRAARPSRSTSRPTTTTATP
jgi:hypothetical protein